MNKGQLIEQLAKKTRLTKVQTEQILDAAIEIIEKSVSQGEEVKLVGFGTFDRIVRKSRTARNPRTGEQVKVPSSKVPRFRPGKDFRERVNPITR